MTKVLQRFNMSEAKPVGSTLLANYRLSGKQSSKTKAEKADMMKIPYASAVISRKPQLDGFADLNMSADADTS